VSEVAAPDAVGEPTPSDSRLRIGAGVLAAMTILYWGTHREPAAVAPPPPPAQQQTAPPPRSPGESVAQAEALVESAPTAESQLNLSLTYYRAGRFPETIVAAKAALKLKPDYAAAWNNIGAAYNSMGMWDEGIAAEEEALKIQPDFQLAKNNLAWARGEKAKKTGK